MQFVPYDLPEQFTAKDFAKHAKIQLRLAQTVLLILTDLEIVVRVGRQRGTAPGRGLRGW